MEFDNRVISINTLLVEPDIDIKEKLVCFICQEIMHEPVQICQEGHVFCKRDLKKWLEKSETCPICRENVGNYKISSNKEIKHKIDKIKIHCPYYYKNDCFEEGDNENGCKEILKYGELKQHIMKCKFQFKQICECGIEFNRNEKQDHLLNICENFKINCEKCHAEIIRSKLTEHQLKECSYSIIQCPFSQYGCLDQIHQIELNDHLLKYNSHSTFFLKKLESNINNRLSLQDLFLNDKLNAFLQQQNKKIYKFQFDQIGKNIYSNNLINHKLNSHIGVEIEEGPFKFQLFMNDLIIKFKNYYKYSKFEYKLEYNGNIIINGKKSIKSSQLEITNNYNNLNKLDRSFKGVYLSLIFYKHLN